MGSSETAARRCPRTARRTARPHFPLASLGAPAARSHRAASGAVLHGASGSGLGRGRCDGGAARRSRPRKSGGGAAWARRRGAATIGRAAGRPRLCPVHRPAGAEGGHRRALPGGLRGRPRSNARGRDRAGFEDRPDGVRSRRGRARGDDRAAGPWLRGLPVRGRARWRDARLVHGLRVGTGRRAVPELSVESDGCLRSRTPVRGRRAVGRGHRRVGVARLRLRRSRLRRPAAGELSRGGRCA